MPSIFINAAPGKNATPHREYSRIIYMSEKWQVVLELWRAVCYDKEKSERGMQMNSQQRRQQLLVLLRQNSGPVSATAIAKEFGVSRQIIVGDVALLRAAGEQISATPRGYVLKQEQNLQTRTIACRHDDEHLLQELYIAVDNGCAVLDVTVEHPIYGQLTGPLQLASRADVDAFLASCAGSDAQPLSALTEGIHLHTLACPSPEAYAAAQRALTALGVLFTGQENRR